MKQLSLRLIVCGTILALVITACSAPSPASPLPAPTATRALKRTVVETRLTAVERAAIFDKVWQTVNGAYFDPAFGGKDWKAIGNEYRRKLATVQDDDAFWRQVLNPMLFELGVSHMLALPAGSVDKLDPMLFTAGWLGMDARLLDGELVVTRVVEGSPAAEAGLKPGYVVVSVDGWTLEDVAADMLPVPPANARNQLTNLTRGMRALLYGEPGKQATVEYLDAHDRSVRATLQHVARSGCVCGQIVPSLPQACAEIEVRRLEDGTGYLRLSGFALPALESVLQAINDLHGAPALIIDLRGNAGGDLGVLKAIAGKLVGEPKLFARFQDRNGLEEAYLDAVPDAYGGKVVILVDETSTSASEGFSGSLQALRRATIVGSQTPGSCLPSLVEVLPTGAILLCPVAQQQTADGRVLEDNGVVPDVEVALDRSLLSQGRDSQLEAAIAVCSNPGATSARELVANGNGVALHVRVAGDLASGNVLVAIHGGPGMTHDYMLGLEKLAGPDLAVVTYDQRGVGRSSSPQAEPGDYTLEKYAEDLDAVRQAIGVDAVHLFGHSWGGIVAMRYATLYPERVRSIVLLGSGAPTRKGTDQCALALVRRVSTLVQQNIIVENPEPGSPEAQRGYLPAYFSDPRFWFAPDDPGGPPLIDERTPLVNELTWAANEGYDLTADLAGLGQRVLNLWGEDDPIRPISSPAIVTALPNAAVQTVMFSHCGHFWQECPESFFAAMRAFLGIEGPGTEDARVGY
jgi:C-terminal processing protease CtpA/Prc/pimeloyl-ACP methyl ester carboxylesterase